MSLSVQGCGRRILLLFFSFLFFCSPKRDNPYDPNSDFYKPKTTLEGICLNRTGVPVANCRVTVQPRGSLSSLFTLSDSQGRYQLRDCPAGETVLVFAERENFLPESILAFLSSYKKETLNFVLEGLPKFLNPLVSSQFFSRHIPKDSVVLNLKCEVKDEEGPGDISSVFGLIEGLPDTLFLLFKMGNTYENSFREESLSRSLDEVVGLDIYLFAKDIFGNLVKSSPLWLVRVIREPPEPVSPSGGESVPARPWLVWSSPRYLFSHSYFCEVYLLRPNLPPVLYSRYENILPTDTSLLLPDSLIPSYYYWQIGVKDSHNNWAKSAEAVFRVGTPPILKGGGGRERRG